MEKEPEYLPGTQPGNGTYLCMNCKSFTVKLAQTSDCLPPCKNCGNNATARYELVGHVTGRIPASR